MRNKSKKFRKNKADAAHMRCCLIDIVYCIYFFSLITFHENGAR